MAFGSRVHFLIGLGVMKIPACVVRVSCVGALIVGSVFVGTSCKKEGTFDPNVFNAPNDSTGTGSMSANIDGSNFSASGKGAVTTSTATAGSFSIVGTASNGGRLSINAVGVKSAGTYSMSASGSASGTYAVGTSTWLSTISGGSGSIVFTTLTSTHATGTFSFTGAPVVGTSASGNKSVTSGTFDVSLPAASQ